METLVEYLHRFIKGIGNLVSLLILGIVGIITYEVVARYLFNAPTSWAWLVNKQLFGVFVLTAGSYAMIHGCHIRIEMVYQHFPKRGKVLIKWLTLLCAFCFLGALLWKGGVMGKMALAGKEVAVGVFKLPLYPLKLYIPFAALLFLVGCVIYLLREE